MRRLDKAIGIVVVCLASGVSIVHGEVAVPPLFSDHMVVQQGIKVAVWGTAGAGEQVTVKLKDRQATTTAGPDGRWRVDLAPLTAGGPFELTVAGSNTLTFRDVLVGEVWVCSGQSNMQWPVDRSLNAEQEIAAADFPRIRLFSVTQTIAEKPRDDVSGTWRACSAETVPQFSAVAYYFGRELHKSLDVPVGLIQAAWGGTPAETWTSLATLEADPNLRTILTRGEEPATRPAARGARGQARPGDQARQSAPAPGGTRSKPVPKKPAVLYNGMIHPLIPYGIAGAIWYQGEANAGRAYQYRTLFPAMIRDWRKNWGQGDFPFLFVQLANYQASKPEPGESSWAELREAQLMTLSLPKTGMAVTIDIGEADNIHPKNKQDVGRRLMLAALAVAHGKKVAFSGPVMESSSVAGDSVRIRFKHAEGGLVAKGGETLKGFAVAGEDRKFVWAEARIDGDSVVVRSDKVTKPVAVRYAWADNPECNLCNKAGLPASPFRTDDWPGVTVNVK